MFSLSRARSYSEYVFVERARENDVQQVYRYVCVCCARARVTAGASVMRRRRRHSGYGVIIITRLHTRADVTRQLITTNNNNNGGGNFVTHPPCTHAPTHTRTDVVTLPSLHGRTRLTVSLRKLHLCNIRNIVHDQIISVSVCARVCVTHSYCHVR